ncbi:GntR family transcriptional regulator [Phenylobacterium sp.]|jgi:DNA-binding transcriptional MocR family regulator|uniref:GntR family transcriptional regulator n=1 Tax=Phenylobacterium sp. TaxID=1871053 RepID=UPI002F95F00C
MAAARPRSYSTAIQALRARLREGSYPPGQRICAVEVADELGLSATPVREALCRLSGEGLLEERRGQGFFVPVVAAEDVADLYRLSLVHLLIALGPGPDGRTRAADEPDVGGATPVTLVEALFMGWVRDAGSRSLVRAHGLVQVQLGPLRRAEAGLLDGLEEEALDLARARAGPERLRAVRRFHARRIALASGLAEARLARAREGAGIWFE